MSGSKNWGKTVFYDFLNPTFTIEKYGVPLRVYCFFKNSSSEIIKSNEFLNADKIAETAEFSYLLASFQQKRLEKNCGVSVDTSCL